MQCRLVVGELSAPTDGMAAGWATGPNDARRGSDHRDPRRGGPAFLPDRFEVSALCPNYPEPTNEVGHTMTNESNSTSGAHDAPVAGSEISLGRDIDGDQPADLQAKDSVATSDTPNPADAEPSSQLPAPKKNVWVPVRDIQVVGERRAINPAKVQQIAASMVLLGQRTPITVRMVDATTVLVAGLHRLEAAKSLGWTHIRAVTHDGDETDAADWEDDENLARAELTVLEWAEGMDRRRRRVVSQGVHLAPPGGQQPKDVGINKAAEALGVTRDEIRRAKRIAGLSMKAKVKAKQHSLEDNQAALLEIAEQSSPDAQVEMVAKIAGRMAKSSATRSARSTRSPPPPAVANTTPADPPAQEAEHDEPEKPGCPPTPPTEVAEEDESATPAHSETVSRDGESKDYAPQPPAAETLPSTGTNEHVYPDLPSELDRRPAATLPPQNQQSLAELQAAWDERHVRWFAVWAEAHEEVRVHFFNDTMRHA
jgi:ParB/RepB/Spo0J family partition protein